MPTEPRQALLVLWLTYLLVGVVASVLGVLSANLITHFSRIWIGTDPNTEFYLGGFGFLLTVALVVASGYVVIQLLPLRNES